MRLCPANLDELRHALATANGRRVPVTGWDLHALGALLEHHPEDMTATAQAGMSLADFQHTLAQAGQWLPLDPPFPKAMTLGALIAGNHSGPRRWGFGTARDWLIGISVVLPDGRLVKSGGKVVKNVAGFDLCKVFVGSHGTLGIIVEATFKVLPLPKAQRILQHICATLEEAGALLERVVGSRLHLDILDLHRLPGSPPTLVMGFGGPQEDVDEQCQALSHLGICQPGDMEYDGLFHKWPHRKCAVMPSALMDTLARLEGCAFVARAGNGVIYHTQGPPAPPATAPSALQQRLKDAFDPHHTLPSL